MCVVGPGSVWDGASTLRAEDAAARGATNAFPAYRRPVMTWVPHYAVARSRERLTALHGMPGPETVLTHLGLQFWAPTANGTLARVGAVAETGDTAVRDWRDWAHARGIRLLLCVYNAPDHTWDWPMAKSAFAGKPGVFVEALVAETRRLGLDGVDVDLEGNGSFEGDRTAFVDFVGMLSGRLHSEGLHLTVDTFAYVWNAPNQRWWPELLPLVDGLTTMGYEETGAGAPEWRSFAFQKAAAGGHASRLMIGLPADRAEWRGAALKVHLDWLEADGGVGVSFWDAQLDALPWRSPETWAALGRIRAGR